MLNIKDPTLSLTHLLIDADHTIFDFDRCQNESLEKAFKDSNLMFKLEYNEIYTDINKYYWKAFEEGKITREELKEKRFQQFFSTIGQSTDPVVFHKNYVTHLSQSVHYYEGAVLALDQLAKKYTLGLITNGLAEVQRPRLSHSGIQHLFAAVIISGEIGWAKPDLEFFNAAFKALNNPKPQQCLVIGDNLHADIWGGQLAGTRTCWFNYQQSLVPPENNLTADFVVYDWQEVIELLWV